MQYCLAVLAAGALLLARSAVAAPQVLGLMASNGPVPLRCDGDDCGVVIGTFCLQRERAMPSYGTLFEPTHPERLTLLLTMADGAVRRAPAAVHLRIAGHDGYTTVRVSLPRAQVVEAGASAAALEIGPGIALVPVPQAGDAAPQSPEEIALAAGPMRLAAGRYLDQPSVEGDTIRVVTALLSAVPAHRSLRDDPRRAWETATADLSGRIGPAALARARATYDRCAATTYFPSCLLYRQREMMETGNRRFWDEATGY